MRSRLATSVVLILLTLAGATAATSLIMRGAQAPQTKAPAAAPAPAKAAAPAAAVPAGSTITNQALNAVVAKTCNTCHTEDLKEQFGNLSLDKYDVANAAKKPELSEKIIRKLRLGMMPPPQAPKPDAATASALLVLAERLETAVDAAAALNPNPGTRPFQRLNRAEYKTAVKDLLGLDVDPGKWLPLDIMGGAFDNSADAQLMNPTVLTAYLNAATEISRMAVGDKKAADIAVKYSNSEYNSQNPSDYVPGAPFGTRGGIVVDHVFPADGDYVFSLTFSQLSARAENIDISVDGERVALLAYNSQLINSGAAADRRSYIQQPTQPIHVTAGQHRVSAAYVKKQDGPLEDVIRPHDWSSAGAGSGGASITLLTSIRDLFIKGPSNITGISDNAGRQKVFSCRPTVAAEERTCASKIVAKLGSEAFRRTLTKSDTDALMKMYDQGVEKGGFEIGIRTAVEGILASPNFTFKFEQMPTLVAGQKNYPILQQDLATRLSFFLWGTPPDDQLESLARQGKLKEQLDQQVTRMLADPRAEALGTRFAAQWFHLANMYKVHPDPNYFPNFDEKTADAMKQETVMFFNNLVRENRSALEMYTANYTFINERLARVYGIPNVAGAEFRKVMYPADMQRKGILGQGSIQVLTSPASRTSPVQRGKWVMETLLGSPPPPPPPGVPPFDTIAAGDKGKVLTTRDKMEMHRAASTCMSCHRVIDPIGLAMDNFDPLGRWRLREGGQLLVTNGNYYDGTPIASVPDLVGALTKRPLPLLRTFTENLMGYAVGRQMQYFDQPAIRAIVKKAEASKYSMQSFIRSVVQSDAFQMKRIENVTDAAKGAGRN